MLPCCVASRTVFCCRDRLQVTDEALQGDYRLRDRRDYGPLSLTVFICILIHSGSKVKYTCDEGYDEVHIHIVKFVDLGVAAMQGWTSLSLFFNKPLE